MMKTKNNKGFTLIELLIVMSVMVIVGGLVAAIMIASLRISNKSTTLNDVRQNGDFAISQMTKIIEYGQFLDHVVDSANNSFTNCVPADAQNPPPVPPPAPPYSSVAIVNPDGGQTTFACAGNPANIASQSASATSIISAPVTTTTNLINTGAVTIDPNSCYFTCSQSSVSDSPIIGIHFSLSSKNGNAFAKNSHLDFQTSVLMRNSSR